MATKMKTPRRLRLRPGCSVAGLIKDKTLPPGLYLRGKNVSEEVFDKLLGQQFSHAVEALPDRPAEEPLAAVTDVPKASEGDKYLRKKREAEERKYLERWPTGRPVQTSID